ncbi:MAG TPA: hypothetical protein PKA44_11985 [Saprospiraceae bacterium]|nr:hypothetical protein [Saprospiraceae bacterium]HRG22189.1 hypothetical protein [Saprospiraceae bacterium]
MKVKISLCLLLFSFGVYSQNYSLKILERPYVELENGTILCKDSILRRAYFTLDEPISVLNEEIDSIFIVDLKVIHIGLGTKKSKEFDLFVPLSCPIKKLKTDTTGFSISYEVTGEVGKRKVVIQWKGVRPDYSYSDNDAINLQVIIDEENNTVSYAYGKLLPFLDLILSVWVNNRQLSIYFVDNLKGFNDVKYNVQYINKDYFEPHDFVLNSAVFTGGPFSDIFIASKTPFDLDDIEIKEGLVFEMGLYPNSVAELNEPSIVIYPNPASENLYIKCGDIEIDEIVITDQIGREILKTAGNNHLPIHHLIPGLYYVSLYCKRKFLVSSPFYKVD